MQPCQCLDFVILISRTVSISTAVVEDCQVCGTSLQQPQEINNGCCGLVCCVFVCVRMCAYLQAITGDWLPTSMILMIKSELLHECMYVRV